MKTTVQKRLGRLAGLLLLSLLVFATGIQTAQAAVVAGSGSGPGTASATQEHGSGFPVPGGQTATQAASSGTSATTSTSSRTTWIAGSAAVALLIVIAAWELVRRRRQPGELASMTSIGQPAAAYCAQHPEDSQCRAA